MGAQVVNGGWLPLQAVAGGPLEIAMVRHRGSPALAQITIADYSHWSSIRAGAAQSQAAFDTACTAAVGLAYSALPLEERQAQRAAVLAI